MVGYCDTLDRIFLSKGVLVLTDRSNMVVIPLVIPEKTLKTSDLDIVLLVISSNITSNITTSFPPLRGEVVILLSNTHKGIGLLGEGGFEMEEREEKESLVSGRSNTQRSLDAVKRKEVFLAAYEEWGTIRKACEIAGISRLSYGNWHKDPEFAKRFDLMRQSFAESLEGLALDRVRNPDKNRGSDILLIGLLNANMPQKYRPQFAMSEDSAKELIIEWRKAAKEVGKGRGDVEEEKLPVTVERTLSEILERRSDASEKGKEPEGDQQ